MKWFGHWRHLLHTLTFSILLQEEDLVMFVSMNVFKSTVCRNMTAQQNVEICVQDDRY
jgi:hypothetical protein